MDRSMKFLKENMLKDKEEFASKWNIEDLFIWELADKWIDINIKNVQEFEPKVNALGGILNDRDFIKAVETSKLAFKEKEINDTAIKTAELIKKVRQSEIYIKNKEIAGYKILSKYEEPAIYKTDSFIVQSNMIIRLYNYLQKKVNELKKMQSEE